MMRRRSAATAIVITTKLADKLRGLVCAPYASRTPLRGRRVEAVDCQGLAGAFTLGTKQAGFDIVAVKSLPGGFGVANLEANRHLLGDGWDAQVGDWNEWDPHDVAYVFGNPPCSGFSLLNRSRDTENARGPDSKINQCMWAFARYVARVKPVIAAFESVQFAGTMGRELMRQLHALVEEQTGRRWFLVHTFMSGASVGAAQFRRRYFWVISQVPFGVEPPRVNHVTTYFDALGDLQDLEMKWEPQRIRYAPPSAWAADKRNDTDTVDMHIYPDAPIVRRMMALIDEWAPGENFEQVAKRWYDRHGEMPHPWQPGPPHKIMGGPVRVRPDRCGYVITGAGGFSFVHWRENRILTLRECARMMGFPDSWTWTAARSPQQGYMWVGKQIPVQSGKWVSGWVKEALQGNPGGYFGDRIGEREYVIDVTDDYQQWYVNKTGEQRDGRSVALRRRHDARVVLSRDEVRRQLQERGRAQLARASA